MALASLPAVCVVAWASAGGTPAGQPPGRRRYNHDAGNLGHDQVLNSLRMRSDLMPLCDQHFRTMEPALAPYNADYCIEFFRCTDKFCHRCFGERIGYTTPKRGDAPVISPDQPVCDRHGRPMFIISLDRQRNHVTYACAEPDCTERVVRT